VPGLRSKPLSESKLVYLLNADQVSESDLPKDAFVVYQGHHGDNGAHLADLILPGAAYTEKSATFVNTEGRSQMTRAAVSAPGAAREDWKIIRALSEFVGVTLPYDDIHGLHHRLTEVAPHLILYGVAEQSAFPDLALSTLQSLSGSAKTSSGPLRLPIDNFYLTDPISRSSSTMAQCSRTFVNGTETSAQATA
jgi:NADH dehydrogenase (ubiquinone) Fe-S protein 1